MLQFHVGVSLIGLVSGLIVAFGLLTKRSYPVSTGLFLVTTILTSVTGFFLPPFVFDPPRVVGSLSLMLLAVAVAALYVFHLSGAWRWLYIVGAVAALYLNAFVGVVQAFGKLSFLEALAPNQSEPPFVVAQLAVLILFIVVGIVAVIRFHSAPKAG